MYLLFVSGDKIRKSNLHGTQPSNQAIRAPRNLINSDEHPQPHPENERDDLDDQDDQSCDAEDGPTTNSGGGKHDVFSEGSDPTTSPAKDGSPMTDDTAADDTADSGPVHLMEREAGDGQNDANNQQNE